MKVEVVAIGTELLLGQIVDTNSSWIGEQLALAGIDSHYQTKVGDNPTRIAAVLRLALARSDAVICCGGLGPTQDDVTREVIAEVMGVELRRDDGVAARIEDMFARRGRTMPANNLRQAMIPIGARTMAQQPGTAPGLICPVGSSTGLPRPVMPTEGSAGPSSGTPAASPIAASEAAGATLREAGEGRDGTKVIYAVPGVPYEMREMIEGSVIPDLIARSGESAVIQSRVLRTWGSSESGLAERLAGRIEELDGVGNPTLAFLASGVEGLKVRITAKSPSEEEAEAVLDREEAAIRDLIGDIVFGVDDQNMESVVVSLLAARSMTVAVAESLTGGYLAGRLCAVPGASRVFQGGVVAYQPKIKFDLLDVEEGPIVTERAALAMAHGVRRRMGADIGLATTGVAGPDEAEGQPVGTVCLAVASADTERSTTLRLAGDRERIRQFSTISLLDLFRRDLLAGKFD